MDIEKVFERVSNMSEFEIAESLSNSYIKSKKVKALSRILSQTDENSEDYEIILKKIASYNR